MTRGSYFDTRGLHFGSLLHLRARPAEPVGHFGSLSGKKCEKVTNGPPIGFPNGMVFITFAIFL